jgi:DNA replication and repair protein RecF
MQDLEEFNFIHGLNGSCKTSILESIHTLALTRSFRSRKMQTVIAFDQDALTVRGEFSVEANNKLLAGSEALQSIGVRRSRHDVVLVKVNGEKLASVGELAGVLPVQVINPASFELLEGSPGVRRQFLDWGVFHVKHSGFYELWPRYRKALQQRNSLLRRGNIEASVLAPWDAELAATALLITAARQRHFEELARVFDGVYRQLLENCATTPDHSEGDKPWSDVPGLSLEFNGGWKDFNQLDFAESLRVELAQDIKSGFTRHGPHRADIDLRCGKLRAGEVLSRGQIKTIVCALKLAQSKVLLSQGIPTVFLIDDLAAELDEGRCRAVFSALVDLDVQVFATAVKASDLHDDWCNGRSLKRFHVKHGRVDALR